jgi:hypothetical protein
MRFALMTERVGWLPGHPGHGWPPSAFRPSSVRSLSGFPGAGDLDTTDAWTTLAGLARDPRIRRLGSMVSATFVVRLLRQGHWPRSTR